MRTRRELLILLLLALLPVVAYAPAWWQGRLLGPGEGTSRHFGMRAAVWQAYARGELPAWNPASFCGTPLLAAYRPGALYPPMVALSALPPFTAFQLLVLLSLSATGVFTYLYARRQRAGIVGSYVAALAFALGPYAVGHLADTASVVAAPLLPLLLLAGEAHLARATARRAAGLALALALLLLAGSTETVVAGVVLLVARLLIAHFADESARPPSLRLSATALVAGVLLAAPQLVPTLLASTRAGGPLSALLGPADIPDPAGLIFRYVSHTPAAALALAAMPLLARFASVRLLAGSVTLCLALQWAAPPALRGPFALTFDFLLSLLAGVSLGALQRTRRFRLGQRLRAYLLFFLLASAAALSVSATMLGPLPALLAGPVGVLAFALILFFPLASNPSRFLSAAWLLPLTVSFLLQPHGRGVWSGAVTRREIERGSATRESIERRMGPRRTERTLTLAPRFPREEAVDLAFAGAGALAARPSANGDDPMSPLRTRQALGFMSDAGLLPPAFFWSDPTALDLVGVRWVQVASRALAMDTAPDLQLPVTSRRVFPLPILPATELRLVASVEGPVVEGEVLGRLLVRLASGRSDFNFPIAAADLRTGGRASFTLPGRFNVDAVTIDPAALHPPLTVQQLLVLDARRERLWAVSPASAYVSDAGRFREIASTPAVRLLERVGSRDRAWVAERLIAVPDRDAILARIPSLASHRIDPYRQAMVEAGEAPSSIDVVGKSSATNVERWAPGRIDLRAEGPGWLVVAESADPGWSAFADDAPVPIVRANHMAMAVPVTSGSHRVSLRYQPPGLWPGLLAAGLAAAWIAAALVRRA